MCHVSLTLQCIFVLKLLLVDENLLFTCVIGPICLNMASKQEIFLPFDEKTLGLYCNTHLKYF